MTFLDAMRKLYVMLLSIAAVSALALTVMTVALPDHTGELRMSAEVGDHFTIEINGKTDQKFTVTEVLDDGYKVEIDIDGDKSTYTMMREEFYRYIYLDKNSTETMERYGRIILDTQYGKRMCTLYDQQMGSYWIDTNGVIYMSFVGGVENRLLETSLFID